MGERYKVIETRAFIFSPLFVKKPPVESENCRFRVTIAIPLDLCQYSTASTIVFRQFETFNLIYHFSIDCLIFKIVVCKV